MKVCQQLLSSDKRKERDVEKIHGDFGLNREKGLWEMENWKCLGFIREDRGRVTELAEESFNNTDKI